MLAQIDRTQAQSRLSAFAALAYWFNTERASGALHARHCVTAVDDEHAVT